MPNTRRLQHDVARLHTNDVALAFVQDVYPTRANSKELEVDLMVVHIVRHFTSIGYRDVRSDVATIPPARDEITVDH